MCGPGVPHHDRHPRAGGSPALRPAGRRGLPRPGPAQRPRTVGRQPGPRARAPAARRAAPPAHRAARAAGVQCAARPRLGAGAGPHLPRTGQTPRPDAARIEDRAGTVAGRGTRARGGRGGCPVALPRIAGARPSSAASAEGLEPLHRGAARPGRRRLRRRHPRRGGRAPGQAAPPGPQERDTFRGDARRGTARGPQAAQAPALPRGVHRAGLPGGEGVRVLRCAEARAGRAG